MSESSSPGFYQLSVTSKYKQLFFAGFEYGILV